MRKPRTFTSQFKREVVEELVSGTTGPAQLARRYNLSSGLLLSLEKTGGITFKEGFLKVNRIYTQVDTSYEET